ncbi:MAG: hypothetical protein PT949_03185 [Selenomonadales bacterium]|nr:hypothetical protein [Selenomonadales bacterium]MDD7762930.1 hypothetical protein [Selenomonadales bacterium]
MVTDCSSLLLPMFNECFHEHYMGKERLVLLQNEHFVNQQDGYEDKRVTDSFIVVIDEKGNKKTYHVETQSTPDNSMLVRMFEYGAQLALDGGEKEGNVLTVTFPHAAVLFLRHNEATPEEMLIRMITPGGTVEYSIPVMKVRRYSIDEIFDKKLYFLIPFYIFTHESRFDDYEADESKLAVLLNEYRRIVNKLEQLQEAGELDAFTRQALIDMGKKVVRHLAIDKKKILEGVEDIMGGKILDYEAKDILNKGREEGIVLGQAQMLTNLVLSKLKKHKSPEAIADALEISEDKVLDIARQNGFAI